MLQKVKAASYSVMKGEIKLSSCVQQSKVAVVNYHYTQILKKCEKGTILIIVIFLLFPLEANTNDNYVVDGRIFGRMHSWPVQSQHWLEEHV